MRLTALRLHDVRLFADRGIAIEEIGEGVNVLCAANEQGKSTCFDALQALFFLQHTSDAAAVQALRPYSGGHPLIEAEIATPKGRYRLAKQFAGRRRATVTDLGTGRILHQAGEAEDFITGLVRAGPGGPAGLLWVRQGNTGLDRAKDEDREKRAREGVLSSVRGEVEALTGGRRMAEVAHACNEDLARLVTPTGRPKAGGPFAAALAERDRLAGDMRRLQGEADVLRGALDRRREARRRLEEITAPAEEAGRREALARAEAEHRAAGAGLDAANAAETDARFHEARRVAAEGALETYRGQLGRIDLLTRRHRDALARRDDIAARRREATRDAVETHAAVMEAEDKEAAAKAILVRLEKALRARQDAERRTALEDALGRAEETRDEIERLEALLRTLVIPAAEIRALERLDADIAGMRAGLTLDAATVRVAYSPTGAGTVSLDGAVLRDGEERVLPTTSSIWIAGIGVLTVTVPILAEAAHGLEAAEEDRAARLRRLGVDSLAGALTREETSRERRLDIELARQRLAALAPRGLAALRDEHAALLSTAPRDEAPIEITPEAAREALAAAEERAQQARAAEREARPRREKAADDLIAAEKALVPAAADLEAIEAALGPVTERPGRLEAIERECAAATKAATEAKARAEALRDSVAHLPRLEAVLKRARSALAAAETEAGHLREEIAGLSGQIGARSEDAVEESLAEAIEAHRTAEAEALRVGQEVAALSKLREALDAARASARDHYFAPVMRELTPLLGLVFDDASVVFDDATLLPREVRRKGLEEPVGALSGGSREQLAVLTRLAFGRLLAREGHPAPVILDDALVYSDDERIERMFDVLHRQADDQQIIVFTCRQRAFARLGGHVLRMVPWRPEA